MKVQSGFALQEATSLLEGTDHGRRFLFQEPEWWAVLCDGFPVSFQSIVVEEGGRPIALFPLFIRKKFFFEFAGTPLRGTFTPYIGLIPLVPINTSERKRCLLAVSAFLQSSGAGYIEFAFSAADEGGPWREGDGWLQEQPKTFVLEVGSDEDALWKNMEGRGRNMVRKAQKKGVTIRPLGGTAGDVELFYDMLKGTFAKSGVMPPHPKRFYESLVQKLMPANMLQFLAAEFEGKTVAMGLFPHNQREIHYLSGTSLPEANKVAANNLIQWEVIRFASSKGIATYDLGGVGIPSIDRFKASFGARKTYYNRYVWMKPSLRLAHQLVSTALPYIRKTSFAVDRFKRWQNP